MRNIAIGIRALNNNSLGQYNIGIGNRTLSENVSGSLNVAIGRLSLSKNNADGNTAVGICH